MKTYKAAVQLNRQSSVVMRSHPWPGKRAKQSGVVSRLVNTEGLTLISGLKDMFNNPIVGDEEYNGSKDASLSNAVGSGDSGQQFLSKPDARASVFMKANVRYTFSAKSLPECSADNMQNRKQM